LTNFPDFARIFSAFSKNYKIIKLFSKNYKIIKLDAEFERVCQVNSKTLTIEDITLVTGGSYAGGNSTPYAFTVPDGYDCLSITPLLSGTNYHYLTVKLNDSLNRAYIVNHTSGSASGITCKLRLLLRASDD